jgi:MFS family permease
MPTLLMRNRWVRMLGVTFVMYVLAHVDRGNLAMAAPYVRDDLRLTPAALGFASGLFFWGYIILQIPAGRFASTRSPKQVLLCLMLLWSSVVAICRAGSFSGAAHALGISQPTLSKSIARLESKLGIKLFERTNANARPTVYGQFVPTRVRHCCRR